MPRAATITGLGKYLPSRVVSNKEVAASAGVDEDWIEVRTGIRERRMALPSESSASLGVIAAGEALASSPIEAADLDLIIAATCTPDHVFPSTASLIQAEIGANAAGAFDLNAACSGFVYALALASAQINAGLANNVMVVGTEVLSRITNPTDPVTAPLFGDGAGAAVLQAGAASPISFVLGSDGRGADHLIVPAGGSRLPASASTLDRGQHFIRMSGREVYRSAVRTMTMLGEELDAAGCDLLIGHQANSRILEECARQLGLPADKVFMNIDHCGNTSSASIPIAMHEAWTAGRLGEGNKLVLVAFGAGYSWAGASLTWTMQDSQDPAIESLDLAGVSS